MKKPIWGVVCAAALCCAGLCACQQQAPVVIDDAPTTAAVTTTTAYAAQTGWVNTAELMVRSGPGTQFEHTGGLVQDQEVKVIGHEGDWYKVTYDGGDSGYVSAAYIRFTEDVQPSPTRGAVRTTAPRNTQAPTTTTQAAPTGEAAPTDAPAA